MEINLDELIDLYAKAKLTQDPHLVSLAESAIEAASVAEGAIAQLCVAEAVVAESVALASVAPQKPRPAATARRKKSG
jgi:hypothetical protein